MDTPHSLARVPGFDERKRIVPLRALADSAQRVDTRRHYGTHPLLHPGAPSGVAAPGDLYRRAQQLDEWPGEA